ncbi:MULTISPECIES: LysR family transcriptional regulator [unclassified Rhodococcus (in: high G+C Gram-positive bacteria)]|uniref:LysR family transcriptional regulator n=1 Tax=unclassified Rhodococcus (in: high G+C Gram-positive bacteria) TaxID=192944 RepID=UPI00163A7558|nr:MULTISPECIES: LysR family transcriptional regulator [unclassified Rhodococcus (in: high G+C Gram-positive bacteria)]MBC2640891.1 LysR family transcriptional regulator [Rhodococcus sp. 3A]MBC2894365.1 LysR family transcriptional regulator [Rhodococcus sp. 4CII]
MSSIPKASRTRARLDLNLIVALEALLRERSVSRAATEVGLSQPAMSAALARLRRYFSDPLLARVGNTYQLTPLAQRLVGRTTVAMSAVERVLDTEPGLEVEKTTREFTLIVSGYVLATVGRAISEHLLTRAPLARLSFVELRPEVVNRLSDQLRTADLAIVPRGFVTDLPSVDLFTDPWVCLVAQDNPDVGATIDAEQLRRSPWAVFQTDPRSPNTPLHQVKAQGIDPHVQVVGENYLALPHFLAGTDRVALAPIRLAHMLVRDRGVRIVDTPLTLAPLRQAVWWHPMNNSDPELLWLRSLVLDAARSTAPADGPPENGPNS